MKQAFVSHPGVMVSDMLEDMGIGVRQFARNIGVTPATVSRFLSGRTALTPALAIRLSAALGSNPAFWMRLQTNYDLRQLEETVDTSGIMRYEQQDEAAVRSVGH